MGQCSILMQLYLSHLSLILHRISHIILRHQGLCFLNKHRLFKAVQFPCCLRSLNHNTSNKSNLSIIPLVRKHKYIGPISSNPRCNNSRGLRLRNIIRIRMMVNRNRLVQGYRGYKKGMILRQRSALKQWNLNIRWPSTRISISMALVIKSVSTRSMIIWNCWMTITK